LSSRHFFRKDSEGKFPTIDNSMFPMLFDGMIHGIIEQSNKKSIIDPVIDRKGGRHTVLRG
jgi:hypothetical protein